MMGTIIEQLSAGAPVSGDAAPSARILIVDDDPVVAGMLGVTLAAAGYAITETNSGEEALALLNKEALPDMVFLDIEMGNGIDGFEVCRQIKADPATQRIPVIFLTAKNELADEQRGFALGAVDYITKPISALIVLARVRTHLLLKAAADFLHDRNAYLEQEVQRRTEEALRRTEELRISQEVTMVALATLAETRDNETGNHIVRTQHYMRALARHLRHHPRFSAVLDDQFVDRLFKAAPLHDIGKVGIPDRILLKPGRLDTEEFEIMKTHTTLGRDAIETALQRSGVRVPLLETAMEIALSHQEKWDGSGYPEGLAGDAIPLSARLMAVADVYDALISLRVYKAAMTHEQAAAIIIAGRGQHFDPDITDAFIALQPEFRAIASRFAEKDEQLEIL
ncbi:HD domain-containing phosphohydrolase [Propionivibrio sp.]|uniref:HD domain-containing phosphohydrolase n=1 Tax=Propionivibrio sp. TaxID=2212460 RepID=UPI003BEFEE6E